MTTRGPSDCPPGEHPYDAPGSKLGMWLFLFSEAFLFGTMFIAYSVFLNRFGWQFRAGAHEVNKVLGAANTVILLTSSLSIALAIAAMIRGRVRLCVGLMGATVLLAAAFVAIKAFEWGEKFGHGLYPKSSVMAIRLPGEQVYFGLYYLMTGLHGLHVVAGGGAIVWAMLRIRAGRIGPERTRVLENVGLYWHLVDVIWIFLFPLFYLIG
ncbi:MAG: cytochrome c oxidase subunit 3 family protein [Phycisphaerae bacterium]|nr:cytochrome c oxidase subunit 3 family protein [Phycisphaerae bacterium]